MWVGKVSLPGQWSVRRREVRSGCRVAEQFRTFSSRSPGQGIRGCSLAAFTLCCPICGSCDVWLVFFLLIRVVRTLGASDYKWFNVAFSDPYPTSQFNIIRCLPTWINRTLQALRNVAVCGLICYCSLEQSLVCSSGDQIGFLSNHNIDTKFVPGEQMLDFLLKCLC